jgi:predicted phage tail protein
MADIKSRSQAKIVDLIAEGQLELIGGLKGIFLNKTAIQNDDGSFNFKGVSAAFRPGTIDQSLIEGFTDTENAIGVGVELLKDVAVTRTVTNADVDGVKLTFKVPAMVRQNSHGKLKGTSVRVKVAVQSGGAGYSQVLDRTEARHHGISVARSSRRTVPSPSSMT